MTQETKGIKETSEMLDLGLTFGELLIEEIAEDGFQPTDVLTVIMSEKFQRKLLEAFSGITFVPGEMRSLKASGAFALGRKVLESAERITLKFEKEF